MTERERERKFTYIAYMYIWIQFISDDLTHFIRYWFSYFYYNLENSNCISIESPHHVACIKNKFCANAHVMRFSISNLINEEVVLHSNEMHRRRVHSSNRVSLKLFRKPILNTHACVCVCVKLLLIRTPRIRPPPAVYHKHPIEWLNY